MADTIKGEELRARLLEKANSLPLRPGVYIMRDKNDKVIYVGKSRALKTACRSISMSLRITTRRPAAWFRMYTASTTS